MADAQHDEHEPKDDEMFRIVGEEQRVLGRVLKHLSARRMRKVGRVDYDEELLSLRDQIGEARLEDVPALVAQMERLQQVAARRAVVTEGHVDVGSPYFGRIVLQEGERKREVLIGRATYLDPVTGVQIVDWRDAPVSRVYYRYDEGDDYDEQFGGRLVEGEVLIRRNLGISGGKLRRVGSPQGTFLRRSDETWVRLGESVQLKGGQGTAPRPSHYQPVAKLGVGRDGPIREDKHLPEIAALIDARQFELITKPDSGLVVIQGGAGSGKTTIGLHRLAYLAYRDRQRFRPERMLVVVFNDALARYISFVLPALGVAGVAVTTFYAWAHKLRAVHVPRLPYVYTDDTPEVVVRLKKHPAWVAIIDEYVARRAEDFEAKLRRVGDEHGNELAQAFARTTGEALATRVRDFSDWLAGQAKIRTGVRHVVERESRTLLGQIDVKTVWSELLTDPKAMREAFGRHAPGQFRDGEIDSVFRYCAARCGAALAEIEEREQRREEAGDSDGADNDHDHGIDGAQERTSAVLDWEDDALLLRLYQRLQGSLRRGKEGLKYEHVFIDEAQDLSPLELAVVLDTTRSKSVTLAGDVAQRVLLDNGFSNWKDVLSILGLSHVEIEPLRVTYRSTHEIMDFANEVLGHLRNEDPGRATRHGVPVELFRFGHTGDAVGFLAESLRALLSVEPLASVAVITRAPEQVRDYADGLTRAEVPNVRMICDQDFPFRPGVDVTDVRQVKGLEFDYVVLVEVTAQSYPADDESRHLLHIGASRAAHQLWVMTSENPSPLLPKGLCERGY